MFRLAKYLPLLLIFMLVANLAVAGGPEELLKEVYERMDLGGESYILDLEVINYSGGVEESRALVRVYLKNGVGSIATFLAPERMKKDSYLVVMNDTWLYKEGLKRPLRISARQKLFGNAGIAETMGINFAESYWIKNAFAEKDFYVLELQARENTTAYQKARVWLKQQEKSLERVILKGINGQEIKELLYSNYRDINGHWVGDILIKNYLQDKEQETKIIFKDIRAKKLPDQIFHPLMLGKLKLLLRD